MTNNEISGPGSEKPLPDLEFRNQTWNDFLVATVERAREYGDETFNEEDFSELPPINQHAREVLAVAVCLFGTQGTKDWLFTREIPALDGLRPYDCLFSTSNPQQDLCFIRDYLMRYPS